MLAFALRADGWYLRSDIIWHKPNPMPESTRDRPTSAHEHVFLFSKSPRYFYDADGIAEPDRGRPSGNTKRVPGIERGGAKLTGSVPYQPTGTRNARNVWTITPRPFSGAHFATMPPDLVERCIKAGSRPGDAVLDPFGGAGTTGLVCDRLRRSAILIEINPAYADLASARLRGDAGMFAEVHA